MLGLLVRNAMAVDSTDLHNRDGGGASLDRRVGTGSSPYAPKFDEGRTRAVLAVSWLLTAICIIMVGLRFWMRRRFSKGWYSDDWFMLLAMVSDTYLCPFDWLVITLLHEKPRRS